MHITPIRLPASTSGHRRLVGTWLGVMALGAAAATFGSAGPASAASTPGADTIANVNVGSTLALTGLTPSFTLTGLPGDTVNTLGSVTPFVAATPVTMTVIANTTSGYNVTVEAMTIALGLPTTTPASNLTNAAGDLIPIAALTVRDNQTGTGVTGTTGGTWEALTSGAATTVYTKTAGSATDGDAISNDYQMQIPTTASVGAYSVALDYIASDNT